MFAQEWILRHSCISTHWDWQAEEHGLQTWGSCRTEGGSACLGNCWLVAWTSGVAFHSSVLTITLLSCLSCLLFIVHCWLLAAHCSLLTAHYFAFVVTLCSFLHSFFFALPSCKFSFMYALKQRCRAVELQITCMYKVPNSIWFCDYIQSLLHIVHEIFPCCCRENVIVASNPCFDLREHLLNWIEIWWVRWKKYKTYSWHRKINDWLPKIKMYHSVQGVQQFCHHGEYMRYPLKGHSVGQGMENKAEAAYFQLLRWEWV